MVKGEAVCKAKPGVAEGLASGAGGAEIHAPDSSPGAGLRCSFCWVFLAPRSAKTRWAVAQCRPGIC